MGRASTRGETQSKAKFKRINRYRIDAMHDAYAFRFTSSACMGVTPYGLALWHGNSLDGLSAIRINPHSYRPDPLITHICNIGYTY